MAGELARARHGFALALVGLVLVLSGCSASGHGGPASVAPTAVSPSESEASPSQPPSTSPASASAASTAPAPDEPSSTAGASDASDTEIYADCSRPSVEPTEIILTCADGGTTLEQIHWTTWSTTSATGTGVLKYNDCQPSCAQGKFHSVAGAHITLTAPVTGATGETVWSTIAFTPQPPGYASGPYHGGPEPLPTQPS